MNSKIYPKFFLSITLLFSIFTSSFPNIGYAQTVVQTTSADDLTKGLQTIEDKVEARRKELGIPGMSLAIVKDGKVIFMKGFGYKDFEKKIPVTSDTEFAIGSATKAFTALSILISQDEGKLSLDDSPKKYLPYFKMYDAETDKNIQIRDLLSHSSGLNRTDLAMITGKLKRQELIQVTMQAKPTAKLREKFQYQNIMFTAAGVINETIEKMPWEKVIIKRILTPLGMTNSTMSIAAMKKTKDYSFGYDYNFDTKETRRLPLLDIDDAAPAGSINSSAKDMANWLQFVINGGTLNGKRLVSEKGFQEWTSPQMKIAGKMSYGFGWFLQDWNGLKVVQHGGNVPGFNSMVATIPEKNIGFVMLTNVSASSLGSELMPIIWENLLGNPNKTQQVSTNELQKEIGTYHLAQAGIDIEVKMQDGKLSALVPNQPTYVLENVGGRKYKLTGAPDGFFITFKDTEAFLEQPQGNFTLPKNNVNAIKTESSNISPKELIGRYLTPNGKGNVEIREVDGKVALNIEGQQPYTLGEKSKDLYSLAPLPESYSLKVKRNAENKVESIAIVQPEGEFEFKRTEQTENKLQVTVDEVMAKTIDALGGETAMKKITSREVKFDIDFENQGVKGFGTNYTKAPNLSASDSTMTALGKPIATSFEYFDGVKGGQIISFSPAEVYTGKQLENMKYGSDFYGLLNWKKDLKSSEIKKVEKVGDEEAYVVVLQPTAASEVRYYISTKTFLPLKKISLIVSSTSDVKLPITETFSDYRAIDGVMLPFKTAADSPSMGNVVTYLKEVKDNVVIDDGKFKPKK